MTTQRTTQKTTQKAEQRAEKKILLTAIGSFSARAIIKRLKEMGFLIFGMDCYPREWVVNAALVDGFTQVPLVSDEENYGNACLSIVKRRGIDAIFPLTDIEVDYFYQNRTKYEEMGIQLLLPKGDLSLIRDKCLLGRTLASSMESGFSVIEGKDYEEMDFSEPEFPLVAKLKNGRSSEGLNFIYSKDQLGFFLNQIFREQKEGSYFFQKKIEGKVYTVDLFRGASGVERALVRREELRTGNGAGTSVTILENKALEKMSLRIMADLKLYGLVNMEWIYEEEKACFYFLECNPRPSGGIGFSEMAGGDFVRLLIKENFPEKEAGILTEIRYGSYGKVYEEHYLSSEEE